MCVMFVDSSDGGDADTARKAARPFVSVVMAVRNESNAIRSSLDAILVQDYPSEKLEILISDGMSADGTWSILREYEAIDSRIHLLRNPEGIVPTGLNAAIRKARGEIILRVDGHTRIACDYVTRCVAALIRTGADNVGGRMRPVGASWVSGAISVATSTPLGVGGSRFHFSEQEEWVDTVYLGCWRKDLFDKVGLFDEEQVRNQDDEFNYRILDNGGQILLSPEIRSSYSPRGSLGRLWSQYFQYGFWKVRVMQKHPQQMRWRHFVPPAFVAGLSICTLCAVIFTPVPLLAMCAAYLTCLLIGSAVIAGTNWSYMPILPFIFAVLHLSYGTGFCVGLAVFARRWNDRNGRIPPRRLSESKISG